MSHKSESNELRKCWLTRISRWRKLRMPQAFPIKATWRVISGICSVRHLESFGGRSANPGTPAYKHIKTAKASPSDQIPPRDARPFVGRSRHRTGLRARMRNPEAQRG